MSKSHLTRFSVPLHLKPHSQPEWRTYTSQGMQRDLRCQWISDQKPKLEMSIYHLQVTIVKRSQGRSAVAAAAYRAGDKLHAERTGDDHDYTKKGGVYQSVIMAPDNAPGWIYDREALWNEIEKVEKRPDARLAREINIAIPIELTPEQKLALVYGYVQAEFVERGMVADVNFHDIDSPNPHCHIMLSTRTLEGDGFGDKNREWDAKKVLQSHRENWADHANRALEAAGRVERIDHRSLADQGIDRVPQIHTGAAVAAMRNKGIPTDRGNLYDAIETENCVRANEARMAEVEAEIKALEDDLEKEREREKAQQDYYDAWSKEIRADTIQQITNQDVDQVMAANIFLRHPENAEKNIKVIERSPVVQHLRREGKSIEADKYILDIKNFGFEKAKKAKKAREASVKPPRPPVKDGR